MNARLLSVAALPALLLHGLLLGGLPRVEVAAAPPAMAPAMRVRAIEPLHPAEAVQAAPALEALQAVQAAPSQRVIEATVEPERRRREAGIVRTSTRQAARSPVGSRQAVAEPASSLPDLVGRDGEPASNVSAFDGDTASASTAPESAEASVFEEIDRPLRLARVDPPVASRSDNPADVVEVAEADGITVPVYATTPAPSQVLRYQLQRGLLSGTAELSWRHDPVAQPGARFQLQLLAKVGGLAIMTQVSSGAFDKAGLAPNRLTDQRLRGSVRAANFQRQRGVISFSGSTSEYPLVRGSQDRLSWMLQLPAILAANPRLGAPGQQVTMYVVGARGDASVWVFRSEAVERVVTDAGPVSAVKLVREPRKEHDTLAEVWLDPARHHLPVRARIGNPDGGPMLELLRIQD